MLPVERAEALFSAMAALVPTAGEHIEIQTNFYGLGLLLGAHIMRKIIISTTAAITLFSSAALAQKPSQGTAPIPDFSGIWAHPYLPGFEPPAAGPVPVLYRLHTGLNRNKAPAFPHKRWARHRTLSVFRSDYLIREGADGQVQQRPSRATEKSAEA